MGITVTVREAMTRPIVSAEATDSVKRVIDLMVSMNIGSVVVTRDGEPAGLITERDIMKNVCPEELCTRGIKAGEIMSSPLITIPADAKLGEAAQSMLKKNVKRLLVEEKGKIVGIITHKDLIRGTMDTFTALAMA